MGANHREGTMRDIAIIGAGHIGAMIAEMLSASGDYAVEIFDRSAEQLAALKPHTAVKTRVLDIAVEGGLREALVGKYAVLSAAPFHLTTKVAEAAKAAGAHYLDLTEDVASTKRVMQLAEDATTAFIPQCGLAPGFITIIASAIWPRASTNWSTSACASAPCRSFRPMP